MKKYAYFSCLGRGSACSGISTSDSEQILKKIGLTNYESKTYQMNFDGEGHGLQIFITIYQFVNTNKLQEAVVRWNNKNGLFRNRYVHTFLVGDLTLIDIHHDTYSYSDEFRISKMEEKNYLHILNSYRKRLEARLLLPPESNIMSEEYYFQKWEKDCQKY